MGGNNMNEDKSLYIIKLVEMKAMCLMCVYEVASQYMGLGIDDKNNKTFEEYCQIVVYSNEKEDRIKLHWPKNARTIMKYNIIYWSKENFPCNYYRDKNQLPPILQTNPDMADSIKTFTRINLDGISCEKCYILFMIGYFLQ